MMPYVIEFIFIIQYSFSIHSQQRVETTEVAMSRARESFRGIAQRGGVCFDACQYLREINPLYQTSFNQFLELYDVSISHSDRWG